MTYTIYASFTIENEKEVELAEKIQEELDYEYDVESEIDMDEYSDEYDCCACITFDVRSDEEYVERKVYDVFEKFNKHVSVSVDVN